MSLDVDANDRLLVGGGGYLQRYLANGVRDTSFGSNGIARIGGSTNDRVYGIAQQPDGQILAATIDGIWRIAQDGASPSNIIVGNFRGIQVFPDGDLLVTDADFDVFRYSRDAVLEQAFSNSFGTSRSTLALPDNRLLIIGSLNGNLSISRHLPTGAVDASFGNNGLATFTSTGGR